ncbi:uncharacterized protein MONBRDRAFT_15444, partial [Monosiga brevicollis MX1]
RQIDWHNKLYLAPLTTVGNLPFRRLCKRLGADVTCSEMAMASSLLQGSSSDWALVRRHESEDLFGIQICGNQPDMLARCAELLSEETDASFIDLNCGCPIDQIFQKGCGSALLARRQRLKDIVQGMRVCSKIPITVKVRTGVHGDRPTTHKMVHEMRSWGVSALTIHGRSRQQRYTKYANWDYIKDCVEAAPDLPIFGNGDILSWEHAVQHQASTGVSGVMLARGALIKPWLFTEIKEQRTWDISSMERFEQLQEFCKYGLEHWGSDHAGVERTRRFLLEMLSFTCRYIPAGLLEVLPQHMNDRPPVFTGRNDLETLLSSQRPHDWVKISEMLLGPVPPGFFFEAKHKANSWG